MRRMASFYPCPPNLPLMDISLNWLRQCIAPAQSGDQALSALNARFAKPESLAERLTSIGLEVEGQRNWTSLPGGLEGLVVGKVLSAEPHPNADRLKVTSVDVGAASEEPLPIVCGAPNVAAGQHVVVALVGSTLYPSGGDPFEIKKAKIRGERSMGMICAEDEIGTGQSHDGIIVLQGNPAPGTPAAALFGVETDTILEIGLTPNRADAHHHLGVARDLVASINAHAISDAERVQLVLPESAQAFLKDPDAFAGNGETFPVHLAKPEACTRYMGVVLEGVQVGPSPEWLVRKLDAIGVKAINNVVDATNYILHHWGQPLHAFDADKIRGGQIRVDTWPEGTPFTSLEGTERKLKATDLCINDAEGPMCIAGVYGGLNSGVTDGTGRIFLESARFDPLWIRRTASAHGLRTDAASRFEKGTDPNLPPLALAHAVALLQDLTGAQVASGVSDAYPDPVTPARVRLRWHALDRLIGQALPREQVYRILDALGMQTAGEDETGLELLVPTDKTDVTREADLVEEVLRIYGMDRIAAPSFLRSNMDFGAATGMESLRNRAAAYLVGAGFSELFTNPIVNGKAVDAALAETAASKTGSGTEHWSATVALANSLNAHLDSLRPELLFGGLDVLAYNQKRQRGDQRLFEFGRRFEALPEQADQAFAEGERLALWMSGRAEPESWRGGRERLDHHDIKRVALALLDRFGLAVGKVEYLNNPEDARSAGAPWLAYGEVHFIGKQKVLSFGRLTDQAERAFEVQEPTFYADFNWAVVLQQSQKQPLRFQPVPRVPTVRRDLALVLPKATRYADVELLVRQQAGSLLRKLELFDAYEGDRIEAGHKSYGLALYLQDPEATLTDKRIDKIMGKVIRRCETELDAKIRR